MDAVPILSHQDMGMDMSSMDHSGHDMRDMGAADQSKHTMNNMEGMDHSQHDTNKVMTDHSGHDMSQMDHSHHDMTTMQDMPAIGTNLAKAGFGNDADVERKIIHSPTEFGPHVDSHSESTPSGLADPGLGLRHHQHLLGRKVLTYADLRSLHPTRDKREPSREIELHLTGNMHRYMWSINGVNAMHAAPITLTYGERVRFVLINDTMMTHPFHLHGMWSELETGDPEFIPRKHTVLVQPGSRISYLVTADAKGNWAYHCHLLYHMMGMMRTVRVI